MAGRVIAFGNLKGGTGKSTLAVNVAGALAAAGADVLLLDADPQATAMEWASGGLLPLKVEAFPLGADRRAWVRRLVEFAAAHDFVLVDLPPATESALSAALVAVDLVVVPVTPSGADLRATGKALALLKDARAVRRDGKPGCVLVPSKVDGRTVAGRELAAVLSDYGETVAPAVGQRVQHVDAFSARQWVGQSAPRSTAHVEVEAVAAMVKRRAGDGKGGA
jgi:chromosome partitioning protein